MNEVDIVVPWVDGNDPEWQKEKNKYFSKIDSQLIKNSNTNVRYQNWDNMQYWFRAVEKNMPWVNKIFFVTWGHIPGFLNTKNPKLQIIKHSDYIPPVYLPTFNTGVIEINYHRIKDLSENFIIFNDDLFPIKPVKKEYYFKNNMICDEAVEIIFVCSEENNSMNYKKFLMNNLHIINKYFKKRDVQSKNFFKWFTPKYGKYLLYNIWMRHWHNFSSFRNPHMPNAMKKSTFQEIWEKEPELMDLASKDKFRSDNDLTQYLMRFWQICKGNFYPRVTKGKTYVVNINNYKQVAEDIINKKYLNVCINEQCTGDEFEIIKEVINSAFEKIFPEKCSFEK